MKKTMVIFLALCLCIGLCACGGSGSADSTNSAQPTETAKNIESQKADELILAIGVVSAESENAIIAAQAYYDTLTEQQKAEVENYALLVQAQEDYSKIATRIAAESAIEEAYAAEKWGTILTLTKEYLSTYSNEEFTQKAQEYKEKSIDIIDKNVIAYLKAGNLETAKMLLEAIKDDVNGADVLLAEVEEYITIAGEYTASEYSRKKSGEDLPFQGSRESYKLTVTPFMNDAGLWEAQYTVEVPGIFNLAGSGCFTYTCIGDAYIYGNVAEGISVPEGMSVPVATEINPQIDTWNTSVVDEDAIQIYSTEEGYQVVHTIYYKSSYEYEVISQNFIKK